MAELRPPGWPFGAEVPLPSKVVCVAANYRDHAAEMGRPVPTSPRLFLKPTTALVGPGEPIPLPAGSARVDHEAELAVVVGRPLRDATPGEALAGVLGYTCLNDVTARDWQRADGIFGRAKGADGFCPVGPVLAAGLDPGDLRVRCRVDGELRQDGTTADMVFPVAELLAFISRVMTLRPGDIVATGTPAGVGPLRPGQVVEVEIEGIGVLRNPVVARPVAG